MSFKALNLLLICLSVAAATGCRCGRPAGCADPSLPDTTLDHFSTAKPAYIRTSFAPVDEFGSLTELSIGTFFQQDSVMLNLDQVCMIAAQNAPLADTIDKERQALCCQGIENDCVDEFLAGQASLQRNKTASQAAQLFLKLVEVRLQQQLLGESFDKLAELNHASQTASEQGLATVDADIELDKQNIELRKQKADLDHAHVQITAKLNAVLGNSLCSPKSIYPDFELFPVYEELDVCQVFEIGMQNRADLKSMSPGQCGKIDSECASTLTQLDPRLGIGAAKTISICNLLKIAKGLRNDCSECVRNAQLQELATAKQEIVRLEIAETVLELQSSYQKLTIENDNLKRLERRLDALDIASDLNNFDNFLTSIEVWAEKQSARSARISRAIDFEVAKIKLLEATGQLAGASK